MDDVEVPQVLCVTTTVATPEDADRLARELLGQRLAACVQVEAGLTSHYRWEGKTCTEPELRLVIKTAADRETELEHVLTRLHPYRLPQFTSVPMRASAAYARWVLEQTRGS